MNTDILDAKWAFYLDITEDRMISANRDVEKLLPEAELSSMNELVHMLADCVPAENNPKAFYENFMKDNILKAYENGQTELNGGTLSFFDDKSICPVKVMAQ